MIDHSRRIRIWAPTHEQVRAGLWNAIARALSSAFSSREWRGSPMPIGDASDPHSALGIMTQLRNGPLLVAALDTGETPVPEVVGCVLGGVLDESLIDSYRLRNFGAQNGDGILAYIGVAPEAQGYRGFLRNDGFIEEVTVGNGSTRKSEMTVSLAGVLFSTWLELPAISCCPTVFVRTRETIAPILHLLNRHGFEYQGQFELVFRGSPQARLVYRRKTTTQPKQRDVSTRENNY